MYHYLKAMGLRKIKYKVIAIDGDKHMRLGFIVLYLPYFPTHSLETLNIHNIP